MKYWHLQMNQPWGRNNITIDSKQMLLEKIPVIGTGDWDDNQFYNFTNQYRNGLDINDIVLVREGSVPIALCEVIGEVFKDDVLQDKYKNQNFRQVKILSFFNQKAKEILASNLKKYNTAFIQASGTFTICRNDNATSSFIKEWHTLIKKNQAMETKINLLKYKHQLILQGPPGTGKTREAKQIAQKLIENNKIPEKTYSVKKLTKDFIKSKLKVGDKIESKSNMPLEIVDLENKVIVIKSESSKPWKPSYNKIIDSFDNKLWEVKGRTGGYKSYEDAIAKYFFEVFFNEIKETDEKLFNSNDFIKIIQFHPSYTYEDFVRGIVSKPSDENAGIIYQSENKILSDLADKAIEDVENNYVLIIDEINRANLSSVLGELIYALEYRGEAVESMYEVDGSREMTLPPNLYIIGTMNTADRSVGHIDYAIRRRFAFVDVPPKKLSDTDEIYFNTKGFEDVELLFTQNFVSPEFDAKDVQIGHSYFIVKKTEEQTETERDDVFRMKMNYEVKPILREYIKDGILNSDAKVNDKPIKEYIENL